MNPWKTPGRRLAGAAIALVALVAGSCEFGNQITAKNGTEVEGLTGTLVVAAGSPAAGAWVRVFPANPTVLAKGAAAASVLALDSVQAGSSGAFQFKDLANGTYNLAATLTQGDTSFALLLSGVVVVGNTNLGIDTLKVTGSITLQTLSGGAAVANALCAITGSPWQTLSNESGVCVLTGLPPGTFQVTVTHPTYSMTVSGDIAVLSNLISTAGLLELIGSASPLPAAPLLVSPASLSTVSQLQAVLIWRRVAIATSYHVQLSTDSLFASLVINDSARTDTSRAALALTDGTRYYWRVRAKNGAGVSPWSARWSFTTQLTVTGAASLVARWGFDETSGAQALDASGNGRHGVISGPVNRVAGVLGNALEFNGSTHVEVADSLIPSLESFTFTAWVWESSQNLDRPILDFCCTNSLVGMHMWVNTTGSSVVSPGRLYVNLRATSPASNELLYAAPGTLPAGVWNHIAVSYDGQTRTGRIYANGIRRDSIILAAGKVPTLSGVLYMGYRVTNTTDARSGARFIGRLDEVRLYNQSFSDAQMDSLYRQHAPGITGAALTLPASADAPIIAAAPSQAGAGTHASLNFGKIPEFGVGTYDMNTVGRALVRFDLPTGLTAAQIERAVIRLHSHSWIAKNAKPDSVRIYAHRVLRDWKEGGGTSSNGTANSASIDGATGLERFWGSQNGSEDWNARLVGLDNTDASAAPAATATRPRSYVGSWEFDVTALAKAWANQPNQNFGVLFAGDIPAGNPQVADYPNFYAREAPVAESLKPVLIINGDPVSGGGNPVTQPSAASGLVAHWDFNEGTGTTLTDRTGKGHTGTIQGGTWVDGIEGKALSFNGTSSQVLVPFKSSLNMRQFTISAWFKSNKVDGQALISRLTSGGQSGTWNYRLALTQATNSPTLTVAAGHPLVDFWPSTEAGAIGTTALTDGTWRMLTGVLDGTTLKLYVNGVLNATKAMGNFPDSAATEPLRIGASSFGNGAFFQGVMDEVRIYNQPLSAAQVDSLYSLHAPGTGSPVTLPTPPPAAPVLVAPAQWGNGIPNPPTLTWNAVSGATSYHVQMATDSLFNSIILSDSGLTVTTRTVNSLLYSTEYHWRVRARNASGTSAWSTTFRFMTITGGAGVLPTPINILEPLHGATNVQRQSSVRWNGGSGTINLQVVQVALDSAFTQLVTNDTSRQGGSTRNLEGEGGYIGHTMGILAAGTTHFVRVLIGNDAGVRVSETRRFTTVNWTPRYSNTTNALNTVIWNGATYVAAGNTGTVLTSTDGSGWTIRNSGTTSTLFAAASNGSLIVAVGAAGTIRTSSNNGASWTATNPVTTSALYAVIWNGNQFLAGGAGGTLLTSTDGTNWVMRTSGTTNGIYSITSTGSLNVIAGANGMIRTSTDAVTWTARTSGVAGTLYALSWAGNLLTAAGANGTILTSPNGTTWTPQSSGVTSALYSLAWNGTQRVAVGANGIALTSANGSVWSREEVGVPEGMFSVTSSGSGFVTVGQLGHILTMP
jgi:hypothetical protein